MKKIVIIITVLLACMGQVNGQSIKAWKAADVNKRALSEDTTYVFNFWATWCLPCVQELPEFDVLAERYATKPVKIILISLDFKDTYPVKLGAFIERRHMQQEVVWLAESNPNFFIPKIEDSWQGSIPATLIIRPGRMRRLIEGQITAGKLSTIIDGASDDQ